MNEKIAIRVLLVTAILLLAAVIWLPGPATGETSQKEGDFMIATHTGIAGSDVIYIAETRTTGGVLALVYDPNTRTFMPRGLRPIADAFGGR